MSDSKKRSLNETSSEIDVVAKKTKLHTYAITLKERNLHLLKVGTIVAETGRVGHGFCFYVVDSFTKSGAPRCIEMQREVTETHTTHDRTVVFTLIRERKAGAKPKALRLTKDGLCSREHTYRIYEDDIDYSDRSCLYD